MTRISTKVVIDMISGETLFRDWYSYDGPVEECKKSESSKQQKTSNALSQNYFDLLQKQLGMTNPTTQQIIANGGMLPQQEAAMKSLTLNSLPAQYQNLQGQINNSLVARGLTGGNMAGGGGVASGFGYLGSQEAKNQADLLSNIQLQKGQQLQGALGLGMSPLSTFASGNINANSTAASAAQAADQNKTGFWGSLMGGLGSLGGGLGGGWLAGR